MLKIVLNKKIRAFFQALLVICTISRVSAQGGANCFTAGVSNCCDNTNINISVSSITYSGNIATVNLSALVTAPNCSAPYDIGYFNFGDGSAIASVSGSNSFPTIHAYNLLNICGPSVFTIQLCIEGESGLNRCMKTTTISIPHPSSSANLSVVGNACSNKTFVFTSTWPIVNTQWVWGDGSSQTMTGALTSTLAYHTYTAPGTYTAYVTGQGIAPCIFSTQINVSNFTGSSFTYTLPDPCDIYSGVDLSITPYNTGLYTYNWYINNNINGATAQTDNYSSFWQPGTNTVVLSVSDGTCSVSTTQTLNIGSTTGHTISWPIFSCKTYTFQYSGTALPSAQWSFGDGTSSPVITTGSTSISHTYPGPGTYVVSLTGASLSPCSIQSVVTVSDFALADFNYTVVSVCNPASGVILSIPNYNPAYTYMWQINLLNVPATGASATYYSNLVNGTNIIKLTITDPSGTPACSTFVSKVITMGSPSANFSVTSPSVCLGEALSVYGVSSGGDTYTWDITQPNSTHAVSTGMNPSYMFTMPGAHVITLTITTTFPSNITCTNTAQQNVTVYTMPDPTFATSAISCNNSVTLTPTALTNTFTSYTINYGDGSSPTTSLASSINPAHLIHTFLGSPSFTVFPVSITMNNGSCAITYSQGVLVSNGVSLVVNTPNQFICPGNNGIINALVTSQSAGAAPFTYNWSGPSGYTSNLASITVTAGGVYNVTVTSAACSLSLTGTKTMTRLAEPTGTVIDVANITCTSVAGGTANIVIPVDLQIDGFVINGTTVTPNSLATSTINYPITGLVQGPNYITLANGLYEGCNSALLINISKTEPVLNVAVTHPSTCGGTNGSATLTPSMGTGTVSWYTAANYSTTAITTTTGLQVSGLSQNNYIVRYAYGSCITTANFGVMQPAISLTKLGGGGTCGGATTPVTIQAQFSPASVSGTFNYSLKNLSTSVITGPGTTNTFVVTTGNYSVLVSANGCTTGTTFNVKELDDITLTFKTNEPNCHGPGSVMVMASGGDGSYNYAWYLNSTLNTATTNVLSLATISGQTTITATVNDQSGCSASGPTPAIVVNPASIVTLTSCVGPGLQGTSNAAKISICDISACVTGGAAPYTFEWYKLVEEENVVQWRYFYDSFNMFVGVTGNVTQTIVVPTSTPVDLSFNGDKSGGTVAYPYWSNLSSPYKPLLNSTGLAALGTSTASSTDSDHYFSALETVTATVEKLITSYSGYSGQTSNSKNFSDGDYNLHVTDANGCKYVFSMGTLTFSPAQSFTLAFEYVWGMDPIAPAVPAEEVDVVLHDNMIEAAAAMASQVSECKASKKAALKDHLENDCTDLSGFKDALTAEYEILDHHHTLYYYDRAGRLTKTVPPEGVEYVSAGNIALIKTARSSGGSPTWPAVSNHRMATIYEYNSFGQLISQKTPDGGTTNFIYDGNNRLRFSQNDKQKALSTQAYSYTKYDALGRIAEVGEHITTSSALNFTNLSAPGNTLLANTAAEPVNGNIQITKTVYSDQTAITYYGKPQRFTQNRVSYTYIDESTGSGDEYYTYYSYDSHGNVEWIVQDQPGGMDKNYIAYEYDLVSGKVLKVTYNGKRADRFFHRYSYDAENRLVNAETSRDGQLWDRDAHYEYYAHGPLKRNVIGEDQVQGLDYIYTIQGWIKSVNSPSLSASTDPGEDNSISGPQPTPERVAADRFGMVLKYFDGDYTTTATSNFLVNNANYSLSAYSANGAAPNLYNGNISGWIQSQLNATATGTIAARADLFQYDVLNRIKQSTSVKEDPGSGWSNIVSGTTYKTNYTYDANGNILTLDRYDDQSFSTNKMDELQYTYSITSGSRNDNRLVSVTDVSTSSVTGRSDLQATHNYTYDAIGNLIRETGKEVLSTAVNTTPALHDFTTTIKWNVYGKIKEILKTIKDGSFDLKERITFKYDAAGNRIMKDYWKDDQLTHNGIEENTELTTTFYVRDAQGNPLATYKRYYDAFATPAPLYKWDLIEQPIYGSDRVGQNTKEITLASATSLSGLGMPSNGSTTISEYQNWITSTSKNSLLPNGATTDNLCQCKVLSMSNAGSTPNYQNVQNAVELLGIANNGIAIAEDLNRNLQFFVVVAKKYLGAKDVCLIFDRDGKLMKNSDIIGSVDTSSKPVVVNIPGTSQYAVVTLDASKLPVYHIVNMNTIGYGPINNMGEVVSANHALSTYTSSTKHGFHFSGVEDHITGHSIVYSSRYTVDPLDANKGNTEIMAYDFGTSTLTPTPHVLKTINGCGNTEKGQLQISPDGSKLGWWQYDEYVSGFNYRKATLYTMNLDNLRTGITGSVNVKPISEAGNNGNGMFEFMNNSKDILYSQRGVYKEGNGLTPYDRNVWKYDPVNAPTLASMNLGTGSPLVSYLYGEIKRGIDGNYYIPNMSEHLDQMHAYTGSAWNATVAALDTSYRLNSSLPTQVFKIFEDPNQELREFKRAVGWKDYELKDHLGNVRVVISDAKLLSNIGSNATNVDASDEFLPEVLNYTDYYAFGMEMPNRKYTASSSYRYGFNGKENDNEVKGSGNQQDYGMRIYDNRIGKFLSVDPLASDYPYKSPYDFAENDVIRCIDLDGAEKVVVASVLSTYMIVKNPQGRGNILQKRPVPIFKTYQANESDWKNAKRVVAALGLPTNGAAYIKNNDNGASTLQYWYHDDKGVQQSITVNDLYNFLDNLDIKTKKLEREIVGAVNEMVSFYLMTEPIFLPEGEGGVRTDVKIGFLEAESKLPLFSKAIINFEEISIAGSDMVMADIELVDQVLHFNAKIEVEGSHLIFKSVDMASNEVFTGMLTLEEAAVKYKGTNTIKAIKQTLDQFKKFAKEKGVKTFEFEGTRGEGKLKGNKRKSIIYKVDE